MIHTPAFGAVSTCASSNEVGLAKYAWSGSAHPLPHRGSEGTHTYEDVDERLT